MLCSAAAPADSSHEDGVLYEARSWAEIDAFLFGPRQRGPTTTQLASTPQVSVIVAGYHQGLMLGLRL